MNPASSSSSCRLRSPKKLVVRNDFRFDCTFDPQPSAQPTATPAHARYFPTRTLSTARARPPHSATYLQNWRLLRWRRSKYVTLG